jgi:lipopolysaccharide export system protein LptC
MRPIASVTKHARVVRGMKILCVLVAAGLVSLLVVFSVFSPVEKKFKLVSPVGELSGVANSQKMLNPRFQGVDSQNQPYNIVADQATQQTKDLFLLENITADISLRQGGWVSLTAKHGLMSLPQKTVDLSEEVHIFSDSGHEVSTTFAHVDIRNNIISSEKPVHMQGPFGILDAQGFVLRQNEKKIVFIGPVSMKLYTNTESAH